MSGGQRAGHWSVQELNLLLGEGQSLLIVGPSGCGKSSLLRAIAGRREDPPVLA